MFETICEAVEYYKSEGFDLVASDTDKATLRYPGEGDHEDMYQSTYVAIWRKNDAFVAEEY